MKLKILKVDDNEKDLICRKIDGDQINSTCYVDLIVGGAVHSDFDLKRLIGKIIKIPDDSFIYRPVYLPNFIESISEEEESIC